MYFITTTNRGVRVAGDLPLTATEALSFLQRANGTDALVEVKDRNGRTVTAEELRQVAKS